jgi:ComEC/Rec2-related protein
MKLPQLFYTLPPLLFITTAYIFGLCVQHTDYTYTSVPFFLVSLFFFIPLVYKEKFSRPMTLVISLVFSAFLLGMALLKQQKQRAALFHATTEKALLTIRGVITDISLIDHHLFDTVIIVDQVTIEKNGVTQSGAQKIQICTNRLRNIQVSDSIELRNIKLKAPNSASYQHYLVKEGICATIFTQSKNLILLERPSYSINRCITSFRDYLCTTLQRKMSTPGFSIFCPLFLGKRTISSKEVMQRNTELFTTWGITHYLARSGLHLVVLITVWLWILAILPLSFNTKQWVLMIASIIYFILSWSSIPFYRALATLIFYRICTLMRLQSHFLHLLTLTCFLILLINPIQFFFLDFQLSFGLTFVLGLFSHIRGYQKNQSLQTLAPKA